MSKMLASVSSLEEALFIQDYDVDIIDLKQPARGALGALAVSEVAKIVATLNGRHSVSATVGDLPMLPDCVYAAVEAMAATGVDYVKIGFFPGGDWWACLNNLSVVTGQSVALIAVLFADTRPDFAWIQALQQAGFTGVMLDTMNKSAGSLTRHMSLEQLQLFVQIAKTAGLTTGLAGSLKESDIPELLPLQADYLGFRGALCKQHERTAALDADRIRQLRRRLSCLHVESESEEI